jgi:adenylate kinase
MIIIFLGMPASGKGTHGGILSKKLGIKTFSPGFKLREMALINKEMYDILARGEILPEYFANNITKEELNNSNFSLIIDGYPRSIGQVNVLDDFISSHGKKVNIVINLLISKEEALRRLVTRYVCYTCNGSYNKEGICCDINLVRRVDDNVEIIKKRLDLYTKFSDEVEGFYKNKNMLFTINDIEGLLSIDDIQEIILKKINSL